VDRARVATWMEAFRRAWISNDPVEVADLFAADAVYVMDPFADAWVGRDEIVRRWTAGISQQVELEYEIQALEGDVAVIHWVVVTRNAGDPVRVQYDGVVLLRFAGDGRCRELREWYFRRELH
jgi:uncharacterized protein (TIGR02246 family)